MLKIQDSAYLHDGDTAVLTGTKGDPASTMGQRSGREGRALRWR